jgi:hypothetical protein
MKKTISYILLFAALGLYSCGNNSEQTTIEEIIVDTDYDSSDDDFSFVLPSPMQINSIFQSTGPKFNDKILNPLSNSSNYVTKVSKLLNLGIYTSDLCYAVLNDQTQLSLEYLKTVKELSDDIGMSSIFNSGTLLQRFEKNIGNKDSILYIMADIQEETDLYIKRSDQEHLAMIIFSGAWTEGMYIGLSAYKSAPDRDAVIARMVEQMTILANIIKGLEIQPYKTDDLVSVRAAFQDLFSYFTSIEGVDIYDFDYENLTISDAEIEKTYDKIKNVRNLITTL